MIPAKWTKRSLVVAGNCQASFLYRALIESPELNERYYILYFRNFRKGDQGELPREHMENCAVLLEQIAHKGGSIPHRDALPADCRIITFPILWMNSLWPTGVKDPRNVPSTEHPAGPYPYGDRLILKLLDEGLTPEQASARFLQTNVAAEYDLARFHEINEQKARILDERAELKLGAHVLENFRKTKLFHTDNHPTMPMRRHIADVVFDALGVEPPQSDLVSASGGMDLIHSPVHPSVAEHFGLEWYDPAEAYRHNAGAFPIAEYMRRYAAFEP
jgi:hypothetical protein